MHFTAHMPQHRRPDCSGIGSRDPSAVEVTAAAPAVGLGPELPLKLHPAPDPGVVGADVRLDLAASAWTMARSMPSSSAHRSSGAAIGRPSPGRATSPPNQIVEQLFGNE
jgi:hypothetical protein